jgi:hypothetical protein
MIAHKTMPLEARYHRLEVANRWLIGIGAVMLAALLALAAWVAIDQFAVSGNAARVDPLVAALNGDSFADYQAFYATNVVLTAPETHGSVATYGDLDRVFNEMRASGLTVERVGEISTAGPFVTFHMTWSNDLGYEGDGVVTLQFNDTGQIVSEAIFVDW